MTLQVKVNDLHIHFQLKGSKDTYLVQILLFYLTFMTSYHADK